MEGAEQSRYVARLKVEFDSCDTTATGFLDRDELTALCRKLQLDAHLPLLLDTLLGARSYARVNFEEFKDGFVAVLSHSLDLSTSEDDSSYLEPVVTEEVKPKFVKGTKRYGRRSRPDSKTSVSGSEDSTPSRPTDADTSPPGARRAKLRRSTSLESVESLKSDDEAGSQKESFQCKGPQQKAEVGMGVGGGGRGGRGGGGGGGDDFLSAQLNTEDLDSLLGKLDADLDLQRALRGSAPVSCSTPVRSRTSHKSPSEERLVRSTSPSLLTATVGQRVLSRLDEGSGCTGPDRVIALWTEEGIRNSRDILQTLDFPLEERLSLADLTLALDNELLVSGNGIHQAALISYKNEIQHLQLVVEQACRERDKVKADLEQADQRNLQLVREVDDRHASMETLNQSRIRDLEQDFRDRLTALRGQSEQENEALLQQAELERRALQDELRLLRAQGAELQEELGSAVQENVRLEEELSTVKLKLTEAECSVKKLQKDLDQLLHDKFGSLDPAAGGLSHEERFSEILKDYELQCLKIKELRDRNDELSSELELLRSQRSDRKSRRAAGSDADSLSWSQQRPVSAESDSDESEMKRGLSPRVRKKLQPVDKMALGSLDDVSGPAVSIQTELALETLKQKHNAELQQLHIQLETQVNYYERSLEVMRQSMEVERKDISQAFKMEISELEEQKSQAELQAKQLKDTVEKLHAEITRRGRGGGLSPEQEHRMQRERAEQEQNFAREIGNLVQSLSAEKEQLGAELKLKMDQEVMLVRQQAEQRLRQVTQQHARTLNQLCAERRSLEEQVSGLHEALSQSEAGLEDLRTRLDASYARCSELEARTEEDRDQLESLETSTRDREQEVLRLVQENQSYARLADQLSNQIVEMEEEISTLREHLRGLSVRLNDTADLVLELRGQLNARTGEAERLRESRDCLEREAERDKRAVALQLMELEKLVLDLEQAVDPGSPRRTQLEEVRVENSALQERLRVLQQEVLNLEDDVAKKRRKVDEVESDHQKSREEAERLHKENARYREEVLDLSSRNLQLSDDNAELSARLRGDQESVRMLRERLEEETSTVRRLQDAATRREKETLTQHAVWTQERELMEREIAVYKDKLCGLSELEAELSSAALKLQRLEEEKAKLLRDADDQNNKVAALQRSLLLVESEAERLQTRLHTATHEENQEVTELQTRLLGAQSKVEELESSLRTLIKEQEELRRALKEQEEHKEQEVQEETHRLRVQNQELQHKLSELQVRGLEVQDLTREQQILRTRLSQLETERTRVQDQATRAQDQATALGLARVQHDQNQAELQRRAAADHQEQAERLQERLQEEQGRSRRLEEALKLQERQAGSRADAARQRHEKTAAALQRRTEELEVQLKGIRLVLGDKVQQLKEQLARNSKASAALQDVYVENSQLMSALQVTERRQKDAEKKNFLLEDRVRALNALLRDVVMATLAT